MLMIVVIASGFFGLYSYLNHPVLISKNREGGSRAELFAELFELTSNRARWRRVRAGSRHCSREQHRAHDAGRRRLRAAVQRRRVVLRARRGSAGAQRGPAGVIDFVAERLPRAQKGIEAANLQQLIVLLCRRQAVLRRIRRDIRLRGWLKIWLYFHIP